MLGNRHSQHSFATQPDVNMSRSKFNRSYGVKDTYNFDYLVPFYVDEVLPGDTINLSVQTFQRLATQKVPIMDNMYVDYFFFFVPNRLVWDNWERFMGAQDNPGDSTDFICPQLDTFPAGGPEVGTIYDKMGMVTDVAAGYKILNTFALRSYNLIWAEWFRDENLQMRPTINKDDGPDAIADYNLLKRGKRHDYFTSALPFLQKGLPVTIPLGTSAPVLLNPASTTPWQFINSNNHTALPSTAVSTQAGGYLQNAATVTGSLDPGNGLYADLSAAAGATINALRQAIMVQSLLELDARGGTRYVELLLAHFKVTSPDFRLQRPEYLGGGELKINSHPVPQTSATAGSNPQAQLAAFGTSSGSVGFSKSFVEHGIVLGLVCARGEITYQQGLNKMWSRSTKYDYYWPKLQELGEQSVLNKEIYVQGTSADNQVFGYQERYAEYRYHPSEIHGEFRSTFAQSLDYWHLAEEFSTLPALNATFITQNTPIERAIAVTDAPDMIADYWLNYTHSRPMATYSVPASLGKF